MPPPSCCSSPSPIINTLELPCISCKVSNTILKCRSPNLIIECSLPIIFARLFFMHLIMTTLMNWMIIFGYFSLEMFGDCWFSEIYFMKRDQSSLAIDSSDSSLGFFDYLLDFSHSFIDSLGSFIDFFDSFIGLSW